MSSFFSGISSDVKTITNLPKTISTGIKTVENEVEDEYSKLKEELLYKIEYGIVKSEGFINKYIIPISIAGEIFYIIMILLVLAAVKIFTLLFPSPLELETKSILNASSAALGSVKSLGSGKLDNNAIASILNTLK